VKSPDYSSWSVVKLSVSPEMKTCFLKVVTSLAIGCLSCVSPSLSQAQNEASGRHAEAMDAIEVPFWEADEHFASGERVIHGGFDRVSLKIVVTPEGIVQSALPESGSAKWREEAVSLAKAWHYLPFERNGKAVLATLEAEVDIVPAERRPAQQTSSDPSFPEIKDWSSLRITLRRTRCFGTCPSYSLTVSGDGSVVYNGEAYVHYCGEIRGHVAQESVRQLVQLFKRADYFNTFDRYAMSMTDGTTFTTSIAFDDKSKSVADYSGLWVGMPESVMDIEDGLAHLAGPKVWAKSADANGNVNYPCHR
jgi:hypothetical protein